ncbi:glycosyl transferases group 1 [mine drainage metagenome]|uniref:Glycosyl transferases group 1 n=1 Tax=mine drainage metagenome TaxID=410659 RepID=A0A1J5R3A7_9ZZZZ
MKILFVDHKFHTKTKSSNFFLRILNEAFGEIDIEYVDIEKSRRLSVLERPREHDLVVLWQLDFLAPIFLAAGYRTVVVPMYDGSANMPYEHWLAMSGASFVNFSRTLHERVTAVGARGFLCRYYLKPQPESSLPGFDELRAVLWMRRPEDGLTPRLVERLIGDDLAGLHVHNAPDQGPPVALRGSEHAATRLVCTESRWESNGNPYLTALKRSNVFVAPRLSEGIGMAMLEAFSHGLLVLANDDAVHNEYVANWSNGILFNRASGGFHVPLEAARDMARLGWRSSVLGYEAWQDGIAELTRFVADTPATSVQRPPLSRAELVGYWDAYTLGIDAHQRYLRDHFVDLRTVEYRRDVAAPVRALLNNAHTGVFSLDEGTAFFGDSPNSPSNKFGLSDSDALSAKVDAMSVGFDLACRPFESETTPEAEFLVIQGQMLGDTDSEWLALIHVNGRLATRVRLPHLSGDFAIEAPFTRSLKPLSFLVSFVNLSEDSAHPAGAAKPPQMRLFACDLRGATR